MEVEAADQEEAFEAARDRVNAPMRRLFAEYGRQNRIPLAVGIASSVAARLLDLIPPLLLGIAIDATFRGEGVFALLGIPLYQWAETTSEQVGLATGIIAGAFLLAAMFHWTRNWGWNAFAQRIQHRIRTDTYEQMQRLNMDFYAEKQTGEMMSVLSNDVNRLERFLNDGMNSAFRLGVMVLGIAAILFSMNWQLALVTLVVVPAIAAFTYRFIKTIQPKYAAVRASVGALNSRLENNLGGVQVIKTYNTESYEADRVEDVSGEYLDANWDAIQTRIKFFPGLRVMAGLGFVITFLVGGLWVANGEGPWFFSGELTTGEFVVFILLSQRFIWPMAQFGQIINMYQRAYASAERVFGLMDTPQTIRDDPDATPLAVNEGRVEYDDVAFNYDSRDADATTDSSLDDAATNPILADVSFDVAGGETLALVGPTGAGKSTVMKLLLRMYDVDEGAIRIDGQDLRDVTLQSLRKSIGYVSQETFLFYGSVRDNIAYGSFDATDEDIEAAARAAAAHEFIERLPEGYDTMVGERGVKLSGGQRQRIAIARAILKDPEILVLDEATSDVDTETEMLIQRSLDRLTEDRTTFVIAHRLSTVKDADQIIVLEDGHVAERGTHEELLARGGLYANLWAVQAGEIDDLPEEFVRRAAERRAQTDADD